MKNIIFIASHLGYLMDRTPLGGGAMVGLQLVRHWARMTELRLTVLGSGPQPPVPDITYLQLPPGSGNPDLVRLSELGYARFCRKFEAATTEYLIRHKAALDPRYTVVVVNDISESPDLDGIAKLGYPIVSIWHVDVVEFFNRIYLGAVVAPERLARGFAWLEDRGLARLLPDVLRLVFQKQRKAVQNADLLVLPSHPMAETVRRCYPAKDFKSTIRDSRILVLPWGGWREELPEEEVETEASRLRTHYQIRSDSRVLMTLSRISPEKGIHHLLEALGLLEASPDLHGTDICLFICGETAFMRGEAYGHRIRKAAKRLGRFRVFFPGYLSAFEKQAYFRLTDLFVSPSVHESYGLTLVEAMQAGLPILASDHYGVEEILRPAYGRKVSYQAPAFRSKNLAKALEDLLRNPEALDGMGRLARSAAKDMPFAGTAEKLLDAVLGLLEGKRRHRS